MLPVFAGFMWLTGSLATSLAVQYLVWTVVLVFYDIPRGTSLLTGMRGLIPIWDGARVLCLTRQAAPLGLVVLASALVESIPLYFIEYYYGVAALGIFATLAYFVKVGGVLVKSVGQGLVPRMAKHFIEREQREFWKLVGWTVVSSLVLGGVGIVAASLWGAPILHLLYGAEYAAHTGLLVVIMLAGAIAYLSWVANNTLNSMRLFGRQVPLAVSVLLMSPIACALVVPKYGTAGAAWAWVATGCFHLLLASAMVWFANRSFLQDA